MVSGGESFGRSTSSQSTKPWGAQQPYLRDLYARAEELFGQGPYEYGPGRVTGFDPASLQAFNMAGERAGGSPVTDAAQAEATRTLRGEYLDPESNPWLRGAYDAAARDVRRNYLGTVNALGSRLEAAGRTGSGAHAVGMKVAGENLATGLGDLAANLYGGAYESERGRMMGATAAAPSIAETDWRDISALRSVGAEREQQAQMELDDFIARFQQRQYGPAEKLEEFAAFIGSPVMTSRGTSQSLQLARQGSFLK